MNLPEVDTRRRAIILFDGVCNFCNQYVQFIIRRDREGYFLFASLQSRVATSLFSTYRIPSARLNSIVLIEGEQYFTETTALLRICKRLDGLWKWLYALIIFPKAIRDPLYKQFAKYRYTFFGRTEACMIPTPAMRERILEIGEAKDDVSNEDE